MLIPKKCLSSILAEVETSFELSFLFRCRGRFIILKTFHGKGKRHPYFKSTRKPPINGDLRWNYSHRWTYWERWSFHRLLWSSWTCKMHNIHYNNKEMHNDLVQKPLMKLHRLVRRTLHIVYHLLHCIPKTTRDNNYDVKNRTSQRRVFMILYWIPRQGSCPREISWQ